MRVETHKINHDKQRDLSCYPVVALMRAGIETIRILDRRTDNKLTACATCSTVNENKNNQNQFFHSYFISII